LRPRPNVWDRELASHTLLPRKNMRLFVDTDTRRRQTKLNLSESHHRNQSDESFSNNYICSHEWCTFHGCNKFVCALWPLEH
jgi:hypothetical protein